MNTQFHEKDGVKWYRITNNLWGSKVEDGDYLFIELRPLGNNRYSVVYRNIELKDYEKEEIKFIRDKYFIGPKANDTLAFVLGQHYDHFEWAENCESIQSLAKLFEDQTSFDIAFVGDPDAAGVPDINNNIYGKRF